MEFINSTISINPQISSSIPFFTWKNPWRITIPSSRTLHFRPSFSLYLFPPNPSRRFQISAQFRRRTNRHNYLRKKLTQQQQQVSHPQNLVHEFDKVDIHDSNFDNFSDRSLDNDSIIDNNNNNYYSESEGVKESEMELRKKQLGESIMWNKLENWVEQYKKDSEFWGIGSGPIFTVYQDSEGKVERVVVNEDEILRRSRVDTRLDNETDGLAEVDYKITFAKDLAKEMESGSNVIPKNSSVAKFLLSGGESRFVESVHGVTLKPGSFSRISRVGVLVFCGLFVVWAIRGLFTVGEDVKEYTRLEKEMLRRKMKARTEKERTVKGNVEVMQEPVELKSVSFKRPQLDKEELVNSIIKAKGSNRDIEIAEYSGYQNKEFNDKIEEIKAMARHAREIEKRDALSEDSDEEDDLALKESGDASRENDLPVRNEVYSRESIETKNSVDRSEGQFSNFTNAVIPNGTESSKHELLKACDLDEENIHFVDPGCQSGPRENSSRKKLRIIKSAKEAREYLSMKHKKPEVNQKHEVKNDEETDIAVTVPSANDSSPLSGIDISHPSEDYWIGGETAKGNVSSQNDLKKSRISSGHEVSVSNQDVGISILEVPVKEETNIGTSQKHDGKNEIPSFLGSVSDFTANKVDHEGSTQAEDVATPLEKHNSEDNEENETLLGLQMPDTTAANEVKRENWIEKNFHEFEPIIEKIGVGFRDNYQVARENSKAEIMELNSDVAENELEWMRDERLREIVFKVRDNELSGREPFHLMNEEDKRLFFGGLAKKAEQENEKLQSLHEYFHSNIENLDYGADGISLYDPPEKILPRWKNPPAEKNPEFLNNFVEQRKTFVAESLKNSFLSKKIGKNTVHKSEEPSSHENSPVVANISDPSKDLQKEPLVSSKTVIEGSDGSIRAGKKSGKEYWQHTKKWSQGFLDSYNAETDPEVKATMKDIGKDLDRWITEKEIQEAAHLMDRIPEKGQKFIKQKLDKVKREMELFGPQAVVSKYSEYAEEKEEDYLWWLDLPFVLCIELYTVENGEQRVGFYSLEMAPDLELDPKPYHVIGFEDPGDSKNLCYIVQAHMEMLGNGNAFVVARPPKDAFHEAKANGFGVTVIRKGQLQLNIDQTLEEVEESIIEIGSKMYHDKITQQRSVDINGLMKGVFGVTKPTKSKRKRSKLKSKRRIKP